MTIVVGDIFVEITLRNELARVLHAHAEKRRKEPVEVLADIVETVLKEDIVDAVLDDMK